MDFGFDKCFAGIKLELTRYCGVRYESILLDVDVIRNHRVFVAIIALKWTK